MGVCRCCLGVRSSGEPLFKGERAPLLRHMLFLTTGLRIEPMDGLPVDICRKCVKRLNEAFQFRHQCQESDANLRVRNPAIPYTDYVKCEEDFNSDISSPVPCDLDESDDPDSVENDVPLSKLKKRRKHNIAIKKDGSISKTKKNSAKRAKTDAEKTSNKNDKIIELARSIDDSIITENQFSNLSFNYNLSDDVIDFDDKDDSIKIETDLDNRKQNENLTDDVLNDLSENVPCENVKTPKLYTCDTCGHTVKVKFDLITHFRRHTGEKPYKCETCGKQFAYDAGLRTHRKQHTGQKSFVCDICGKGLSTKETLLAHRRLHTGELPFTCTTCGRAFRALTNLRSHRKIHTGDKRHPCEVCNKLFYTKSDMRNHARRHTGERPYACSLCPKRFTGRSNFRLHMKIHAGQKDFKCPLCPKTFVSKDSMQRHGRIHTGERLFECQECDRRFAHRSTLVSHQAIHSKSKDYICDICCQRFGYPSGLYVHRKKKHNIQSSRIVTNPTV